MKKPRGPAPGDGQPEAEASVPAAALALVSSFLADATWDDGSPREPGTVTLFVDGGSFKACLNDRGEGRVAFVSGRSLAGLLRAVSKAVETGEADWRTPRRPGRK